MTNALKALIIAAVNAGFGVLIAFDIALTEAQSGAVITFVNTVLAIVVFYTAEKSPARSASYIKRI